MSRNACRGCKQEITFFDLNNNNGQCKYCVNTEPVRLFQWAPDGQYRPRHDRLQMICPDGEEWILENNNEFTPGQLWPFGNNGVPNKATVRVGKEIREDERGKCEYLLGEAPRMSAERARKWAAGWERKNPTYNFRRRSGEVDCQDVPYDFVRDRRHQHLNLKIPHNLYVPT